MSNIINIPATIYKFDMEKVSEFFTDIELIRSETNARHSIKLTYIQIIELVNFCDGQIAYISSFLLPFISKIYTVSYFSDVSYVGEGIDTAISYLKNQKGNRTFLEWFASVTIE